MNILLGQKINMPNYNEEQKELWVDKKSPYYTGIMAAVNSISFKKYGCFIDSISNNEKESCFNEASKIGLAWFEQ
jgi:hypothetical protein